MSYLAVHSTNHFAEVSSLTHYILQAVE